VGIITLEDVLEELIQVRYAATWCDGCMPMLACRRFAVRRSLTTPLLVPSFAMGLTAPRGLLVLPPPQSEIMDETDAAEAGNAPPHAAQLALANALREPAGGALRPAAGRTAQL
jgi:hypothetical protein